MNELIDLSLFSILVISPLAMFILCLMDKWGVTEYLRMHGNDLVYKLVSCNFCRSFWIGLIISIIFAVVCGRVEILFCPILSALMGRMML